MNEDDKEDPRYVADLRINMNELADVIAKAMVGAPEAIPMGEVMAMLEDQAPAHAQKVMDAAEAVAELIGREMAACNQRMMDAREAMKGSLN